MELNRKIGIILFLFISGGLAACNSAGSGSNPTAAVETYVGALVARDANALINAACASWEANAKQELDSFAAVTVTLQDMQCQESGKGGNMVLVGCKGKIIANYGAEILEINLADRKYEVIFEGGEWRICGYR